MKRIFALLLAVLCLSGCSSAGNTLVSDFFAMDTLMSVSVCGDGAEQSESAQALVSAVESRINELEPALSRTREDGDIYRLNHAGGEATEVSADTYAAISLAVQFAKWTNGAFDPTLAPLTDLWGIGTDNAHVPEQSEIDEALAKTGYQNIELLGNNQVRLANGAMLDLGGIGKGFATDEVQKVWQSANENGKWSMLARLGGNIGAFGQNPNREGGGWSVGIADPDDAMSVLGTVAVNDRSVVTSGDYERYFEQNGKRYHHIFDPATGYPAESGLRSVTVIDETSARADALTTALFVMGLQKGMAFCEENSVAAVFVTGEHEVYATEKARECGFAFTGEEQGYTYAQQD